MKARAATALVILLAILAAVLYLRFGGVTHGRIVEVVEDRSAEICDRIDARCSALDAKLDRIESKLDRLLDIASRPLPDGMKEAR